MKRLYILTVLCLAHLSHASDLGGESSGPSGISTPTQISLLQAENTRLTEALESSAQKLSTIERENEHLRKALALYSGELSRLRAELTGRRLLVDASPGLTFVTSTLPLIVSSGTH